MCWGKMKAVNCIVYKILAVPCPHSNQVPEMGVLHSGISPGRVALHDKALLSGSFIFCRAELTMCCPGAGWICTEGCSKQG